MEYKATIKKSLLNKLCNCVYFYISFIKLPYNFIYDLWVVGIREDFKEKIMIALLWLNYSLLENFWN